MSLQCVYPDCLLNAKKLTSKCTEDEISAYFYGGRLVDGPPTVVPLPASIWLLGSGMLGLLGIARRKRS